MQACTHHESLAADQLAMFVGTLAHLSSYLQTGCPHALHRVRLLLSRLDRKPELDPQVLTSAEALEEFVAEICMPPHVA